MNKGTRKGKLALALLISGIVFIAIMVVMLLTIGVVYGLAQLGVIGSPDGQGSPEFLRFFIYASLVIGFLLAFLTGKIALRPIKRLVNQLDRLANGDFKARLHFGRPIGAHPTFKQVENSFNRAAQELEHTEMLRSDFINNFSHEFKTPIVSIAGFAKLLRRGNLTEKQKEEYLEVIEEESLRLSAMANNVLSLTRVESQTILTDVTRFNLSEQIRGAALLLAEKWTPKNISMEMQFGEYLISANEELLKQVWINLLDNAIKFTPAGGQITLGLEATNRGARFFVRDTGVGMDAETRRHCFDRFHQGDKSHRASGSGLGLAIAREIMTRLGARLTVRSELGEGSEFSFTLRQENQA